jgi:hypothetical protein
MMAVSPELVVKAGSAGDEKFRTPMVLSDAVAPSRAVSRAARSLAGMSWPPL